MLIDKHYRGVVLLIINEQREKLKKKMFQPLRIASPFFLISCSKDI